MHGSSMIVRVVMSHNIAFATRDRHKPVHLYTMGNSGGGILTILGVFDIVYIT
jgi:hypothetical protein